MGEEKEVNFMGFRRIVTTAPESIPQEQMEKNPMQNLYEAYKSGRIGYGKNPVERKKKIVSTLRKNGYSV